MAQKITIELQDDLDGGPASETVRFGVDGAEYEIDLSTKNAAAFRRKLAPLIDHARKAGRGQRRRPARTAASRDRSGASEHGRNRPASRSAPAGASPPASLSSTKPPPNEPDARLGHEGGARAVTSGNAMIPRRSPRPGEANGRAIAPG